MTPVSVSIPDGRESWMCPSCDSIWSTQPLADQCCTVRSCNECRRSVLNGNSLCSECSPGDRETLQRSLYSKAEKVYYQDYDGALLYWDHDKMGPKFFHTRTALEKFCVQNMLPLPRWVWATAPISLQIDANQVLSTNHPDIGDFIEEDSVTDLQKLLDEWSESQEVKEHKINYNVAVILDRQLIEVDRPIPLDDE